MEDYFGFDVLYQINITDVDDKIILRARRNKLLLDFEEEMGVKGGEGVTASLAIVEEAVAAHVVKLQKKQAALVVERANAPEKPEKRWIEALNTKEEETKLKLGQAVLTTTRVGYVKKAVAAGHASVYAELLSDTQSKLKMVGAGVRCAFLDWISALEDGIGSHACSLEALPCVGSNGIPLGSPRAYRFHHKSRNTEGRDGRYSTRAAQLCRWVAGRRLAL
jgi:hypothetical protein